LITTLTNDFKVNQLGIKECDIRIEAIKQQKNIYEKLLDDKETLEKEHNEIKAKIKKVKEDIRKLNLDEAKRINKIKLGELKKGVDKTQII
jgi:acyl-[acyl carrier protein]--UDP-N-acetylglucosamine O-acyltransferase